MDPTGTIRLGRTNLQVTRLGLGTAPLGGLYDAVGDEAAVDTVRRAWQLGLRLFDTAPLYGAGLAERRLGAGLAGLDRDRYVLATKVGRVLVARGSTAGADPAGQDIYVEDSGLTPVFDFSYDATLRSLDDSLRRLGVDRIDIAHIHDPDEHYAAALDGAYRALHELREQGVIGAVSAGMNQSAMLADFARDGDFDCFLLAGRYTLLDTGGLADLLPVAAAKGIAIIAGGVYNSGLLADPRPGATFDYAPASDELVARARRIGAVCARHGVPLPAAAIQFPFGHPAVASVAIGARSVVEIEENAAMFTHPIPSALWSELKAEKLLEEGVPTP
ncbi:oxidoreductase [Actinocatenispora thailandica]|uniref:Oxidoreductase n=1 Tax=Actinocatenispora thailandica TaxID=227318 RepID=A0A7R7HVU1_9ACTN|nr:aldo/keto reductase [Actinocatenispora thailandica]BCJ34507.1 oxidoreductase [Actinocatenispora thailandica]